MSFLTQLFSTLENLTWGWALIPILVVFGIFMTALTGFVQFRYFFRMFRVLAPKNEHADPNQISARQALFVSLGGRVGGGNIAGVAVAITLGGPGAVFWMILAGLLGMSSKFAECTLGQMYRRVDANGRVTGGPMLYLRLGLAERGWARPGFRDRARISDLARAACASSGFRSACAPLGVARWRLGRAYRRTVGVSGRTLARTVLRDSRRCPRLAVGHARVGRGRSGSPDFYGARRRRGFSLHDPFFSSRAGGPLRL